MKRWIKWMMGLGLLAFGAGLSVLLVKTKPEARKESESRPAPVVQVMPVRYEAVPVKLPTQGLVEARQRTRLAAEVGGRVVKVAPQFEVGGRFAEGEPLLWIDAADYEAAVAQAEATVAEAKLALADEQARAEQARRDWDALKMKGEASDLTLRRPQLARAEASVKAAESALAKARRDLERTQVRAPYAGQVAAISVELGGFVAPGGAVAEFYSAPPHEIRLPLSLDDWSLLNRDGKTGQVSGEVVFRAEAGIDTHLWRGKVARQEGEIERDSRSHYVVAEIEAGADDSILQPGLFLQARLSGREIPKAARVPFRAFVDLERVVLVDGGNRIRIRPVKVLRRAGEEVLVLSGIEPGERVCLTQLSDLIEGMVVDPREVEPPSANESEQGWTLSPPQS